MPHTPGPWRVLQGDIVYSEKGRFIADCERTPYDKRPAPLDPTDKDNAYLIAAAPELLEALEQVEVAWRYYRGANLVKELPGLYATIKEAINKAKGLG